MSLQFHAERSELTAWIDSWRVSLNLHVVWERFDTKYLVEDADQAVGTFPESVMRASLSPTPFNLESRSDSKLLSSVGSVLTVLPGNRTADSLAESMIQAAIGDPDLAKAWRAAIRDIKRSMHRGATVVNPVTGDRARLPNHYYTEGALTAARNGIEMRAIAGHAIFEFDECSTAESRADSARD